MVLLTFNIQLIGGGEVVGCRSLNGSGSKWQAVPGTNSKGPTCKGKKKRKGKGEGKEQKRKE